LEQEGDIVPEEKLMSDVIPGELKQKCYALIEAVHDGQSFRILQGRVDTKESLIAVACIRPAFEMMKALSTACKMHIACWWVFAALVLSGFVYNRWILLAIIPLFIAERWLIAYIRKLLIALAATLLALEVLADDFARWGTAFPNERKRASEILGPGSERLQPSWLDFYFPYPSKLGPEFFHGFGPEKYT
jgi:hypothetical protein